MIELKNISTLNIIGFESGKKNPAGISKKNYKLIKENKLTDYQQLKDFYLKLHESVVYCKPSIFCETDGLKKMIMETEYALDNCYNDPELFEYYKLSNTANALYILCLSAQVFFLSLAISKIRLNISQPFSSIVFSPVAI